MKFSNSKVIFSGAIFLGLYFFGFSSFAQDLKYTCGKKSVEQIKLEISQATTTRFSKNDRFLFFKVIGCAMRNSVSYQAIAREVDAFAEQSFKEEGGGIRFKDAVMYFSQGKNVKAIASATVGLVEEAQSERVQKEIILISSLTYPYEDLISVARVFIRIIAGATLNVGKINTSIHLDLDFFHSKSNFNRIVSHFVRGTVENTLTGTIAELSGATAEDLQALLKDALANSDGVISEFVTFCKAQGLRADPSGFLLGLRQNRKEVKQWSGLKFSNGLTHHFLRNLPEILIGFKNYYWNTFKLASFYAVSVFFDDAIATRVFNTETGVRDFLEVVLNAPKYQASLPDWAMPGRKNH